MKTTARRSPADRDRAVARLRTLTFGSGIAGFLAVAGFGALAAQSYDGTSAGITTAAVLTDGGTAAAAATTPDLSTQTTPTAVQATAAPTAATRTAHAATGSS